jgi:hypothetical protein
VVNANQYGLLPTNTAAQNSAALQAITALVAGYATSVVNITLPGTYNITSSNAYTLNLNLPSQTNVFNGGGATFLVTSDGSVSDPYGNTFTVTGVAELGQASTLTNFSTTCTHPDNAQGRYLGTNGTNVFVFTVDYGSPLVEPNQTVYELYAMDAGNTAISQQMGFGGDQPVSVVPIAGGVLTYQFECATVNLDAMLFVGQQVVLKFPPSYTAVITATNVDNFLLSFVHLYCSPWQGFNTEFVGNAVIDHYVQTRTPGRWLAAMSDNGMISFRGNVTMTNNIISWGCDDAMNMRRHVLVTIAPSGNTSDSPVFASNATSITFTGASRLLLPPNQAMYNQFQVRNALGQRLLLPSGQPAVFSCTSYASLGNIAPISIGDAHALLNVTLVGTQQAIALLPTDGTFNYWAWERSVVSYIVATNNVFGPNRGHGLIAPSTTSVLIQHNQFLNNYEGAIGNPYMLSFGEVPLPSNTVIDSNYLYLNASVVSGGSLHSGIAVFIGSAISSTALLSTNPMNHMPTVPGSMSNLTFTNNVIAYLPSTGAYGVIFAGVAGLNMQNNTVYAPNTNTELVAYTVSQCSNVTSANNTLVTPPFVA